MRSFYQVTAELYTEHVVPVINGKQYDTGRGALITLTDCGAVVVPEAGEQLRLYCLKPDGTISYLPGTLSGNAVAVEFTNQLLALPGVVECELQVGTGSDMISTPVFKLLVLPSNFDAAAVESSDEFGALDAALQTVQQYDQRIIALENTAAGLGTASTYGVANNLTQATAGVNVLDAYQGKALNDKIYQQNSTKYQGTTVNGLTWYAARVGKVFTITAVNGATTNAVNANAALISLSGFPNVFTSDETVLSPCDTVDTISGVRLKVNNNTRMIYSSANVAAGVTIRAQIIGIIA